MTDRLLIRKDDMLSPCCGRAMMFGPAYPWCVHCGQHWMAVAVEQDHIAVVAVPDGYDPSLHQLVAE